MRLLVQRSKMATVNIGGQLHAQINHGLTVFLGIEAIDTADDIDYLVKKLCALRIFSDEEGKMNKSILDRSGEILVVSQFTLLAKTKKGNRPSYTRAARPEVAIPLYEQFLGKLTQVVPFNRVQTGVFGADMQVAIVNDGPVTIWIDSQQKEY